MLNWIHNEMKSVIQAAQDAGAEVRRAHEVRRDTGRAAVGVLEKQGQLEEIAHVSWYAPMAGLSGAQVAESPRATRVLWHAPRGVLCERRRTFG